MNGPCEDVLASGACCVDRERHCAFLAPGGLTANFSFTPDRYLYRPPLDWSASSFGGRARPRVAAEPVLLDAPPNFAPEQPPHSAGRFEQGLRAGRFMVTCEVAPPLSTEAAQFVQAVGSLRGAVDAVQVTDNAHASLHLSGLIAAHLLERAGIETILHMTGRDRNRSQLQSDVLGACAVGVNTLLCLTGEHPATGDHPEVKPVFDLDQVQLIRTIRHLRETGTFLSGRELQVAPRVLIGGVIAPLAPPADYRAHDLGLKAAAGAGFVVTHPIFDVQKFREYLDGVCDLGLHEKTRILAGVAVLTGPEALAALQRHSPGVAVPEAVSARLRAVPAGEGKHEGLKIAAETIQRLRELPGLSGISVTPTYSDASLGEMARLCAEAGLGPAPAPMAPAAALAMTDGGAHP
jgi:methylenetetrahydrofolate reductase (NADPH)